MSKSANCFTMAWLVGTAWAGVAWTAPPQFRIVTQRSDDSVVVASSAEQSVLTVLSPRGIGSAVIHRPGAQWPAMHTLLLKLRLRGLEELRISNGDVEWIAAVSSSDSTVRLRVKRGLQETELTNPQDPYWADVTTDNGFSVKVPGILFERNPASLNLKWIDFFR